jgi:3-oxoadipate enol-lactonase
MGGTVAQSFALRHPARTGRLILAATFATMNPQARMFLDAVCSVYEGGASGKQMFDLVCPWLFSPSFLSDPANANWLAIPEDDPDEQPMPAWRSQYLAQRRFDLRGQLDVIKAPTLVLAGGLDQLATPDDARLLVEGIPGASLHTFEHAGHRFNLEAPAEFHDAVRRFLHPAP